MGLKLTDNGSALILSTYFGSSPGGWVTSQPAEPASFTIALVTNPWTNVDNNPIGDNMGLLSDWTVVNQYGLAPKAIPLTDIKLSLFYKLTPTLEFNAGGAVPGDGKNPGAGYQWTVDTTAALPAAVTGFIIYTSVILPPAITATNIVVFAAALATYPIINNVATETRFTFPKTDPVNNPTRQITKGSTLRINPIISMGNVAMASIV